jgi:AcrR family transcriptional regulator
MKKRAYRMKKRADTEEQTRLRITKSIVELHSTRGPSRTSISAIAAHAGVRRTTVYRHFPTDAALFTASRAHWAAANPFPDHRPWATVRDCDERLRLALKELYSYYRETQRMFTNILRDEELTDVKQMLDDYRQYLADARQTLMHGRKLRQRARSRVHAAVGHALAFHVWRSLAVEQGLNDHESGELMRLLIRHASA